ncbi:hypothetical protein JTB14_013625 [Gonioctena quinquepunctata]|nr:hypothetical protein JTB14_013625 [Gonioctena quinquepunctata]
MPIHTNEGKQEVEYGGNNPTAKKRKKHQERHFGRYFHDAASQRSRNFNEERSKVLIQRICQEDRFREEQYLQVP